MAKKRKNEQSSTFANVEQLGVYVSDQVKQREYQAKLKELKEKAIAKQKTSIQKAVADGRMVLTADDVKPVVQKISLFKWDAPIRKKYVFSKKGYLLTLALTMLFMLYLSILGHYLLMAVLASILLLIYLGGVFDPVVVTHNITTRGIETNGDFFLWESLTDFYFTELDGQYFLIVDTSIVAIPRLIFLIKSEEKEPIFILLQDKLLYRDFMNKKLPLGDRLSFGQYIPIEDI
jgi:hypothetical protein